ncbi:hypothetical protein FACS1894107_02720 [Planctomycetales bacterium]|nr:hypothetical protein FACS1894107_02720 [Planctomycetales bacterium]GHS98942.1 hypothetical protein FACS1894108_08000 [Planctomycetales bacterium]
MKKSPVKKSATARSRLATANNPVAGKVYPPLGRRWNEWRKTVMTAEELADSDRRVARLVARCEAYQRKESARSAAKKAAAVVAPAVLDGRADLIVALQNACRQMGKLQQCFAAITQRLAVS